MIPCHLSVTCVTCTLQVRGRYTSLTQRSPQTRSTRNPEQTRQITFCMNFARPLVVHLCTPCVCSAYAPVCDPARPTCVTLTESHNKSFCYQHHATYNVHNTLCTRCFVQHISQYILFYSIHLCAVLTTRYCTF